MDYKYAQFLWKQEVCILNLDDERHVGIKNTINMLSIGNWPEIGLTLRKLHTISI